MGKTIQVHSDGLTTAVVALGERRGVIAGSVGQQVHDGDTIIVRADNFGVRFLGVDAPEISSPFPGQKLPFVDLGNDKWETLLSHPLDQAWAQELMSQLDPGLVADLENRCKPGTARNHYKHAAAAEAELKKEVQGDLDKYGKTDETFRFFLAFARDLLDRYGRFLCYINVDLPPKELPVGAKRPDSYNERLLQKGFVRPYFIWPNVNPFRGQSSLRKAAMKPGELQRSADKETPLRNARKAFAKARENSEGTYAGTPLLLEPFELRYLVRLKPPERWVIDLSKPDGDTLIRPQRYFEVPNPEDRLFVDDDYVPLFTANGWKQG